MNKFTRLVLLCLFSVLLQSCIMPLSKVDYKKKPNPKMAYIYGKFVLNSTGRTNLSIILAPYDGDTRDEEASESYIGFNAVQSDNVDMIAIQPGKYNINGLVNMQKDMTGYNPRGRSKLFRVDAPLFIEVEANQAYYIGDYYGYSSVSCSYPRCSYRWKLEAIKSTMKESTKKLKEQYQHFQGVQTHSLMNSIAAQLKQKLSAKDS